MPQFNAVDVNEKSTGRLHLQLVDSQDMPLDPSTISAAVMTLFNVADGNIINSRDSQDIYNANNVTISSSLAITSVEATDPVRVTTAGAHNLDTGMLVYVAGTGIDALDGRSFHVIRVSPTKLDLAHVDGTAFTASSSGTALTGIMSWSMQEADNAIQDATLDPGQQEEHRAEFVITYNSGVLRDVVRIFVTNLTKTA